MQKLSFKGNNQLKRGATTFIYVELTKNTDILHSRSKRESIEIVMS